MASILRPFSSIVAPGVIQTPQGGQTTVDWTNKITRNLSGCWVGGNPTDLSGLGITLAGDTGASLSGVSPDGLAQNATGLHSCFFANSLSSFGFTSGFSIFIRYIARGSPTGTPLLIGISYSNPNANPFVVAAIAYATSGSSSDIVLDWNNAGTLQQSTFSGVTPTQNVMVSLLATFVVGGVVTLYVNGVANATTPSFGVTGPTISNGYVIIGGDAPGATTIANIMVNMGAFWLRALSADEALSLHLNPYQFIVPAEYDMPVGFLPVSAFIPMGFAVMPNMVRRNIIVTGM